MRSKITVLAMVSVLIMTLCSGCGGASLGSGSAAEKIIRIAVDIAPSTLDPNMVNGISDNEIQHAVTEGLTRTTGGEVAPGIAESWDISEDGTEYTFHLRDAVWSDGVPVTAGDFVYSWRRLADPATGSAYDFATWMITGGREISQNGADPSSLGAVAKDDKTLVVTLEHPTAYFLSYIGSQASFAPVRKDIVEKYGENFAKTADSNVYCGPFILTEATEDKWVFAKNTKFWDADSIKLDGAELTFDGDSEKQFAGFKNGDYDFVKIPIDYVMKYRGDEGFNHYLNGNVDFCYINTTSSNEILQNRDFRLALNYALNRNDYNFEANNGVYKPYNAVVFPGLNGKDGVTYGETYYVKGYAYPIEGDYDGALVCLGQAMRALDITDPGEITIELITQDNAASERACAELKRQWEETLGIHVELRTETRSDLYGKVLPSADYEIAYAGWGPDYNDPYTYLELWRSDNTSYNTYSNSDYDALLDASLTEADLNRRMDMLNKAEIVLLQDAPVVPLQAKDQYYMLDPKVTGLVLSFSNITIDWVYADISK